jgi:hypothetical protein
MKSFLDVFVVKDFIEKRSDYSSYPRSTSDLVVNGAASLSISQAGNFILL